MTTWYSDHYGADGDNDIVISGPPAPKVRADYQRGRLYKKRAFYKGLGIAADVIAMFTMRSGDCLWDLLLSTDSGSAAGAVNVGLYAYGGSPAPLGAAVDADLFASAVDIGTAALDRTDVFKEAATLVGVDRGKELWRLADIGDATLTADPQVQYVVALTVSTTFTTADSIIVLEASFTAGS